MNYLQTPLYWLLVAAGAVLVFLAPFNLKGLGMGLIGATLVAVGLVPILKERQAKRRQGGQ